MAPEAGLGTSSRHHASKSPPTFPRLFLVVQAALNSWATTRYLNWRCAAVASLLRDVTLHWPQGQCTT